MTFRRSGWRRFFRRGRRVAESARDIQFYLDAGTRENIARGMPPRPDPSLDGEQPVAAVKTMDELLESSVGRQRLTLFLLSAFALAALLLAAVGIYGVIAYSVTQRTKELGIRRALGAQQTDILWLVIARGLGLTLAGIAIGIAGLWR